MRNSIGRAVAATFLVMTVVSCGQGTAPTGTTTPTAPNTPDQPAGNPPPASQAPPKPARQWVMPNLVGSTLQQAQDRMQKLTGNPVFITRSHDATGKKRNQVVDSNWKVCSQNIAPGQQVTPESTIDFGAVKLEETCP